VTQRKPRAPALPPAQAGGFLSFLIGVWWKSQNVSTLPSGLSSALKIFSKTFQPVNELKYFFEFGKEGGFQQSLPRAHVGGKIRKSEKVCLTPGRTNWWQNTIHFVFFGN